MTLVLKFAKLDALRKSLWRKACDFDRIPVDTMFAEFSRANPYAEPSGRANALYLRMLRAAFPEPKRMIALPVKVRRAPRPLIVGFSV